MNQTGQKYMVYQFNGDLHVAPWPSENVPLTATLLYAYYADNAREGERIFKAYRAGMGLV